MVDKKKSDIDKIRESSGMADIGSKDDGAIEFSFNHGEKLIIVKEFSIYEFVMADSVDPKRTNENLPTNIQQKIFDYGSESELVCKTLLTAQNLFKKEHFDDSVDLTKILSLYFELLEDLIELNELVEEIRCDQSKEIQEYEKRKETKASFATPSVKNLNSRCKTAFQKADHIEQICIELIMQFYGSDGIKKQSHFPNFKDILVKKYGVEDDFTKFVESCERFMELIRALRNCLDHRLPNVIVKDFELQANSDILTPSIELSDYRDSSIERTELLAFLEMTVDNLVILVEQLTAHICSKNSKKSIMSHSVRIIPEEQRRIKRLRYAFWAPIGEGGYYLQ